MTAPARGCRLVCRGRHDMANARLRSGLARRRGDSVGSMRPFVEVLWPLDWLPSVGFRSWSRFLAVSLQVTWVINPVVGWHYFPPGLQLPSKPLTGLLPICCLVNRGTMVVNSLPKTVTQQRRVCDLNRGPSAPESSTLTTRLPSHPRATRMR